MYCSLSVLRFVFVLDISKQSPLSGYRLVCNTYVVRLYYTYNSFRGASDVRYSRCCNRARVGLSVGITVTVSVPSNKLRVVIVPLLKTFVQIISLVL